MGKRHRILSYNIRIEPRRLVAHGGRVARLEDYRQCCEQIIKDIQRHVDNVGSALMEVESEEVCEYCGALWTEGSSPHNGGCCARDCEIVEGSKAAEAHEVGPSTREGN